MKRRSKLWLGLLLSASIAGASATVASAANHGRYLPDPANTGGLIDAYGHATPTTVDDAVVMDVNKDINAGALKMDCDTYIGGGGTYGGIAISGGFFMAPNVELKPGHRLAWVQLVTATNTGQNDWNLPLTNAGPFPDASPDQKKYPFARTAVELNPPATIGFQDGPNRSFNNPDTQSWTGVLGLVCIEDQADAQGFKHVHVLLTMQYGFHYEIHHAPPFTVDDVMQSIKFSWSQPSQAYLDTLNHFYDGQGGGDPAHVPPLPAKASSLFKFDYDTNCFQLAPCSQFRILDDPFSYPDGALAGTGGWAAHSSPGAKPVQVSGGAIKIQQSAGTGEDVSHGFGAQPANARSYAGFSLKVELGSIIGATDYIAHFRPAPPDTNSFVARVHVGTPATASTYTIGIAAGSTGQGPTVPWPAPLDMGRTYSIVTSYDGSTGAATLWVNPADFGSPSVTTGPTAAVAGKPVASYAFRQSNPAGTTSFETIDNVWVATDLCVDHALVPGSTPFLLLVQALLCSLGGVFVLARRRRTAGWIDG